MSFADCMAGALALDRSAAPITADPELHSIEGRVTIEWPHEKAARGLTA